MDYEWFQDQQALNYLTSLTPLQNFYQTQQRLASGYTHDGQPLTDYEHPSMYATSLAYFQFVHPEIAQELYSHKIITLYSNDTNAFKSELNYYEQNWVWFGIALYTHSLPNLYSQGKI